jgi:hypothetical protein
VVKAAIKADPKKAQNIKARAIAASPRSEKAAIIVAADQARDDAVNASLAAANAASDDDYTAEEAYMSLIGTSYTTGGGGLTSADTASQATNG